jgi:hypothetical protein
MDHSEPAALPFSGEGRSEELLLRDPSISISSLLGRLAEVADTPALNTDFRPAEGILPVTETIFQRAPDPGRVDRCPIEGSADNGNAIRWIKSFFEKVIPS